MANKPTPADFSPTVPDFPSIVQYQPIYGKFDLTTYIQGASDYEIMAFLVQCYNATLKGYGEVTQLSKDSVTAYNQLQTWVNTWFSNLDVKRDIDAKLEQMLANGELAAVIASSDAMIPAIDNYFASEDGNAALSNKTSEAVTQYLNTVDGNKKLTNATAVAVTQYLNTVDGDKKLANATAAKINDMATNGTLTNIVKETAQVPAAVTQYLNTVDGNKKLSSATAEKINNMATTGELGTVISGATDLQKTTTDWLHNNVTPVGSAVVVDKSLTIEGAAADSKATGNSIDSLKDDLVDVYNRVIRRNLLDLSKVIHNKYVSENNGNLTDYNGWSSYEFEVIPNHTYEFYSISNTGPWTRVANIYYALLDKDKNVLSFGYGKELYAISITKNCKYLRISQETKFLSIDRLPIISDTLLYNPTSIDMYVDYSNLVVKVGDYERDLSIDTSYSYDNTIRAISRLGDNYIYPENTLIAFEKAIAKGFRYLLADISWTSDGVPICLHDDTLQRTGRTTSGDTISNTNKIYTIPFSEVDTYDFGLWKGTRFKGTKILKLEDFLMFCKKKGVNCYLELKHGIYSDNVVNCAKLVKKCGMENNTTFVFTAKAINNMDTANEIRTVITNARIGLMPSPTITSVYVNEAISLKDNGDVFLFGWETTTFSSSEIEDMMINNDISFEVGTFDNVDSAKSFIENHPYTKGVESNTFVIGKELLK